MTRPIRLLHLEDSPRDAQMVRDRLDVDGLPCDIFLATGKDSFEAALTGESFDLIISDYNLPGYDGVTALQQARVLQPEVPVILISGTVGEEQAVKCLQIGATDYLLKDRLERLVPAVQRALQEAEARRTRRRAEAALAESEARKAAILDSVLDSIITVDSHGTVLEFNAAAELTFGYTKAAAIGRSVVDLIVPPRFREALSAGLARYLATGEEATMGKLIETMAARSDGSEIPVELAITAIRTGTASIFTGVLRDLTVRREAESALRRERDRAQRYLDTAEVILLKLDTEGRIALVNRYACAVLGRTADELLGRDWIETCLPGRTRAASRTRLHDAFDGDLSVFETPVLTASGAERLIEWRTTLLRDDSGSVTGLFSSGTDITERNHAVEALRTAEERTRFALQSANVGIWDMDYTTGVLRWSEINEAHYGLRPDTFTGTFAAFIDRVHPDDRIGLLATMATANASGADFSEQHRSVWPDGTVRWLSGAGRVQLGRNGKPVRGLGISTDVTDRRILEEQYQQAQKMDAMGRLAGGVAHDFNNLLTAILGYCELLLADFDPHDPRRADIAEIQTAGTSAAGLTRQLLAFSRKEIIEPTVLNLNGVVASMRLMLQRVIGEDVAIELALSPVLASVKTDRGQVEQIIMNLAVNARDAMPAGGTLTIETANVTLDDHYALTHLSVKPGAYVALIVSDSGTGMTPDVLARLFEPFFTTKEPGKGTGLGLATVHGIVQRSGGSVTVDSEPGKGTAFKVYFPRVDDPVTVVVSPTPVASGPVRTETVLVVDDAEGLRQLTRRILQRQGYTVLVAATADEAVRLFDGNAAIDVLLTDVVMPGASGPELTRQLVERRPALKVIYMSGYTEDAIVRHGVLNSGIAFLHKPFTADALGRKIREVLDRQVIP
jgi:PAS domain S-box-containing protein